MIDPLVTDSAKRVTWGTRVFAVWGSSAILLLIVAVIASNSLVTLNAGADWVVHTQRVRAQLSRVLQLLTDIETSERGFAVTAQEQFLEPYEAAAPALDAEVSILGQLVADNAVQGPLVTRFGVLAEARLAHAHQVIERVRAGDLVGARAVIAGGEGRRVMDDARQVIGRMQSEEDRLFALRRLADDQARHAVRLVIWGMGGLSVLLLALSAYVTIRSGARLFRTEQQLATTLRSVGDGVISTDASGAVRFMNPVAESLTGWTHDAALGRSFDQVFYIINEETRASVENPVRRILREGKITGLANHTLLVSRDGNERAIEDSGAPIFGDKGTVAGVVIGFRDVTQDREAQRSLQVSQQRFVALAEAMPQLVLITSPEGTNEYVNGRWRAYTGLNAEDAVGWQIVHPSETECASTRWARSLKTGEPYELEVRLRRHDGAYRWFMARAIAERDAHGKVVRWFGTCTDIDAAKRTEESLRTTEAALRKAHVHKDTFLAILSHELRNPLAPIRSAARLLESPKLERSDLERTCATICRQVQHMAALLDDLMDVSRVTRGVLIIKKQYVELSPILDAALETARPLIDSKQHRLTLESPMSPISLEADPLRLTQVIANLLTNAAKYTDPKGHIHVRAQLVGTQVVISVKDSGIGLAQEMLPNIFTLFSQAQPDSERSGGGLGIGLALVKGLVELHGGTVDARSEGLNRGSEFSVVLPIATNTVLAHSIPVPSGEPAIQQPRRILIADDSRDSAESLALGLRLSGHEVLVAHSGPEAVAIAVHKRPAVIILDIGMPGLSGYEVAKRIRQEAWGSRAMLVALTGWGRDDDKQQARAAGFDHHLTKPIDPRDLESLMSSMISEESSALSTRARELKS